MSGWPAAFEDGPSQKCHAKPGVTRIGGSLGIGSAKLTQVSMSLMPSWLGSLP